MDIENLSKTELIMTALLISFVTALLTGIVMVFLSEDAPDDIIRVTEQITSSEETATSSEGTKTEASTSSVDNLSDTSAVASRDSILGSAVEAVVRITSSELPPQAGVLLEANFPLIISRDRKEGDSPQALFKNGVIANLSTEESPAAGFSVYSVSEASGGLSPLPVTNKVPTSGQSAFVVPLREQPEIVRVTITEVSVEGIQTSMNQPPAVSPLFNEAGLVIALYNRKTESFTRINQITAQN